jgi:hypothetical protein
MCQVFFQAPPLSLPFRQGCLVLPACLGEYLLLQSWVGADGADAFHH